MMIEQQFIAFVRQYYCSDSYIPLHAPNFQSAEREAVLDAIDSTFVSSVGKYVDDVECQLQEITGAKFAVATVSGTAALQVALRLAGVGHGTEVITQPLSFVATANAIQYLGAEPVFLDIDKETMSLCPKAVEEFLENQTEQIDGRCFNRRSGRQVVACAPMHSFGIPGLIEELVDVCSTRNLEIVEDAAEALGSTVHGKALGTFGQSGVLSFNGNKIVTAGGGGAILTDDPEIGRRAKHLTTTAKSPHSWHYVHDEVGYNYRMPNLNAALLYGQLKRLDQFVATKRTLASLYHRFFRDLGIEVVAERPGTCSNYWLNAILLDDVCCRDRFLELTNASGIMTRPAWTLLCDLPMYKGAQCGDLAVSRNVWSRLVNVPSSPGP